MKAFIGWILASFGLLGLAVELDHLLQGERHNLAVGLTLGLICLGSGLTLIASARAARRSDLAQLRARTDEANVDTVVFQIARQAGGRITAAQIVADTPLSFAEATQALEALSEAGACHMHLSEKGVQVYHFPDFGAGGAGETFV